MFFTEHTHICVCVCVHTHTHSDKHKYLQVKYEGIIVTDSRLKEKEFVSIASFLLITCHSAKKESHFSTQKSRDEPPKQEQDMRPNTHHMKLALGARGAWLLTLYFQNIYPQNTLAVSLQTQKKSCLVVNSATLSYICSWRLNQ